MSDRARRSHSKDSGVSGNNASLDNSTVSDLLGSLSNEHEDLDFEFETSHDMEAANSGEKSTVNKISSSPYSASIKSNQSDYDRNFGHRSKYLQRVEVRDNATSFRRNYLPYVTINRDSDSQTATFIDSSDEDALLESDDDADRLSNRSRIGETDEDQLLNLDSGNNSTMSKTFFDDSEDSSFENKESSYNSDLVNNNEDSISKKEQPIIKNVTSTTPMPSNFSITLNVSSDKRNIVAKTLPSVQSFKNKINSIRRKKLIKRKRVNIEPEKTCESDSSDHSSENTHTKKKKWNLKFDTKALKLSLCDTVVKYISEEEVPVEDSNASNLKVTVSGSEKTVVPGKGVKLELGLFKRPLKRPPTRQKPKSQSFDEPNIPTTASENISLSSPSRRMNNNIVFPDNLKFTITNAKSGQNTPELQNSQLDSVDDCLSIVGSTTIYRTDEDRGPIFKTEIESDSLPELQEQIKQLSQAKVQEWMKTQDNHSNSSNNSNNNEEDLPRSNHFNFKDLPSMFKGICFGHFFRECRYGARCSYPHVIFEVRFLKLLRDSSRENLLIGYQFSKRHRKLFDASYPYFSTIFSELRMLPNLLAVLDDVFDLNFNLVKGIDVVLNNLEKTKMTPQDAVDYVNTHSSILYNIVHRKPIRENWLAIMRLTSGSGKLDTQLASDLINKVTGLGDRQFSDEVYQHLVGKQKIDISHIPPPTMIEFRKSGFEWDQRNLDASIQEQLNKERASVELEQIEKQKNSQILEKLCEQNLVQNKTIIFEPPKRIVEDTNRFTPLSFNSNHFNRNFPWSESAPRRPMAQQWPDVPEIPTHPVSTQPEPYVQYLDHSSQFMPPNGEPPTENYWQSVNRQPDSFKNMRDQNSHRSRQEETDKRIDLTPGVRQYEYFSSEDEMPFNESLSQRGTGNKNCDTDSSASTSTTHRLSFSPLSVMPARPPVAYNRHGDTYDPQQDYVPLPKKIREKDVSPGHRNETLQRIEKSPTIVNPSTVNPPGGSQDAVPIIEAKAPEKPVFGKLQLGANYELEVSLHVLYTEKIENVDINEEDVAKLNGTIWNGDGRTYLQLLEQYKQPATIQNFVTMTIAHLKCMNQMVFKVFMKLLKSIEEANPYYYGNKRVRVVLEVVTMNILYELEKRVMWEPALQLLETFTNWDTLITSRVCAELHRGGGLFERYQSLMGRYFFIAKILVFAGKCYTLSLAFELLQCPSIHLLEAPETWPFSCPSGIDGDLQLRDGVLREFFRMGYLRNVVVVDQMYKKAKQGGIYQYDYVTHISPMVSNLVNLINAKKEKVTTLKQLFIADMNLYTKYLDKGLLRAVVCLLCDSLAVEDAFKLYEKAVEKGIYSEIKESEPNIVIWTNMFDKEIELILNYYFAKITRTKSVPSTNVKITVLKTSLVKDPKMLENTNSVHDVHLKLKKLLSNKYKIDKVKSLTSSQLEIDLEALKSLASDEDERYSVFI